jgi:hypothetical protein
MSPKTKISIILFTILSLMILATFITFTKEEVDLRTELAQVREIAEAARINTYVNADNLRVVKKHWPGARHEQLDFMAEVITTNQGGK